MFHHDGEFEACHTEKMLVGLDATNMSSNFHAFSVLTRCERICSLRLTATITNNKAMSAAATKRGLFVLFLLIAIVIQNAIVF